MIESISTVEYKSRVAEIQRKLVAENLDVAVISRPSNVFYFSGFRHYVAIRALVVVIPCQGDPVLMAPKSEYELAERTTWISDVRYHVELPESGKTEDPYELLSDIVAELAPGPRISIGLEFESITVEENRAIQAAFKGNTFENVSPLLNGMRVVKSTHEIELMRTAGEVVAEGWKAAVGIARPGVPEYELALAALTAGTEYAAELYGLPDDQYLSPVIEGTQILIASGRSSMGHGRASTRKLEKGDLVMMCFCVSNVFKGYRIGFTRHFSIGQPSSENTKLFNNVLAAQAASLDAVAAGVPAARIDEISRDLLRADGLEEYIGRRTGRGVGIDVAEGPELKRTDPTILAPGMTVSVEPAIYIRGQIGLEIEDTVLVTEDGHQSLTPVAKEILVV